MLLELKDISPVRKEVAVEIPADTVRQRMGEVTSEFARQVKMPGFRQGKAPRDMVLRRYRKDIESEVMDRLLPVYFREAIEGSELEPVGDPILKSIDDLLEDRPLKFVAEFEIKPKFDLREYRGLAVTEQPIEVNAEEVEQVIGRLRDQSSSLKPLLEDRAAREGDVVTVDIVSRSEEIEPRRTEDYDFQLGEGAPLPELNESLQGRKPGDEVSFTKSYGEEDAPNDEVRGKTVQYEVTLKAIREIDRPEVDDDFAKSAGFESVDEMRAKIEGDLARHKEHDALQAKRRQISEQLDQIHPFEVPGVMIESEIAKSLRNYARYLASQRIDLDKAAIDWHKVRDEFLPDAKARARRTLILEAIAAKEGLTVSDTEVDAEIRRNAPAGEYAEVRQRLREDGTYESLRHQIIEERALDLVLGAATSR